MRPVTFTATLAAAILILMPAAASAGFTDIQFYKDNHCGTPDFAFYTAFDSHVTANANCTYGQNCPNDLFRSVLIGPDVASGTVIQVWDSPTGSSKDDWARIVIKTVEENLTDTLGRSHGMCIRSFETTRSGANYEIYYHRKNGLDGKVSLVRIISAKPR